MIVSIVAAVVHLVASLLLVAVFVVELVVEEAVVHENNFVVDAVELDVE